MITSSTDNNSTTTNLTQSQLLLWTGQELSPEAPLYNMAFNFTINGLIDVDCFRMAFQGLIDRCDAMRTVFGTEKGMPQQYVLSELAYSLELLDWTGISYDLLEWTTARSQQLFDIQKICFDSVLIKLKEDQYIWYLNQHHLITDAWSVTVQHQLMVNLYQQALIGGLDSVAQPPQFQKYIVFEKKVNKRKAQDYWTEKIQGLPVPPKLYGQTGPKATTLSKRIPLDLGSDRSEKVRVLITEPDVRGFTKDLSMFNVFATLLFAYLYRISGQEKLAIGTPSHNRQTQAFKRTAGVFIELFPLTIEVEASETFGSLLQKVKKETNNFLRYAQPGTSMPELSRSFNVVLNYINVSFGDFNGLEQQANWLHAGHCDPRHHMRLQVTDFDQSGSILLGFDLNEQVLGTFFEQIVPEHFLGLMDAMLDDRSQSIEQVDLVTKLETDRYISAYNRTTHPPITVLDPINQFEAQAAANLEFAAIQFGSNTISYASLNQKANQFGHYLLSKGLSKDHRIALALKRTSDLIIGILGCLKAGLTYIPIASDYPKARMQQIIRDGSVDLILCEDHFSDRFAGEDKPILQRSDFQKTIEPFPIYNLGQDYVEGQLAYIMYTSGSTGKPKGVMISRLALAQYLSWVKSKYVGTQKLQAPLFTSIGFDLTVTSLYLPLICGGLLYIYEEPDQGPDLTLFNVVEDNLVNFIKLTPSHLNLIKDQDLRSSQLKQMLVGGEDFKTTLAEEIVSAFGPDLEIYNEYGPTEATVGCIVQKYETDALHLRSVPIGKPAPYMRAYVLGPNGKPCLAGLPGELYLAGEGLAEGYWGQPELTGSTFTELTFQGNERLYRTGDVVRFNQADQLEYLGRKDHQVKIGGMRVELGEIEALLSDMDGVEQVVVDLQSKPAALDQSAINNCVRCGLPSNYPNADLDETGTCSLCRSYENYQANVQHYFKGKEDLIELFDAVKGKHGGAYDCLMLLSGGKDSTYALAQLVELDLKVLTFTLDNGYISEQAKANIRRVVQTLGVDHVFGSTPAMNEIFVDSLERHANVCDGCFKTIYTLSMKIALEKGIPYIVTGLSRGQFFETRLTEELFWNKDVDIAAIDQTILEARKAYHKVDDAVKRLLDVSIFEDEAIFEKVQFVDFYRFTDVSLAEMYRYLDTKLPWVRPTDTGRSTNCLINQLGIYVHKKEKGYSNYAFPYSWDVRIGHKTRAASLEEINEYIDEDQVKIMMKEIGYEEVDRLTEGEQLTAYYVGNTIQTAADFRKSLGETLPNHMVPTRFVKLESIPLTTNAKVDRGFLRALGKSTQEEIVAYVAPDGQIEEMLAQLWMDVLNLPKVGTHNNFLSIGGSSLTAIRLITRINDAFRLDLSVNEIFEYPTIEQFAKHVEATIIKLMEKMN